MNNSTNSAGSLHPDQPDDQGEHPEVMPWPEYVAKVCGSVQTKVKR